MKENLFSKIDKHNITRISRDFPGENLYIIRKMLLSFIEILAQNPLSKLQNVRIIPIKFLHH